MHTTLYHSYTFQVLRVSSEATQQQVQAIIVTMILTLIAANYFYLKLIDVYVTCCVYRLQQVLSDTISMHTYSSAHTHTCLQRQPVSYIL